MGLAVCAARSSCEWVADGLHVGLGGYRSCGQLPNGPGVGCGTTIGVPVRHPPGPGARARETAMKINAAVIARTRATAAATGAGSRLGGCPGKLVTGTSVLSAVVAAMIAPSVDRVIPVPRLERSGVAAGCLIRRPRPAAPAW